MGDAEQKATKVHRGRKSGPKADKKKKKHVHEQELTDRQRNPRAFSVQSVVKTARAVRRTLDIETKKQHIPLVDRTPLEPPPIVVAVVGPPKVGKTTLIKGLIKNFTRQNLTDIQGPVTIVSGKKRRLSIIECNNDINCLIDIAKVADLVLLLVDASFGFEMETFEFLNIVQVHGFPRIMGVLTHLDTFKQNKVLKKTKKRMKHRFWTEIYQGAKLFYISGLVHGEYNKMDIRNLGRFISVMKFRPLTWRTTHPYIVADRMEDLTDPEKIRLDGKCDRSIALYGYVRGTPIKSNSHIHIPGCGDFPVHDITFLPDPCPLPEKLKKRVLNEKERLIYAPMSGVGGIVYDKDVVYIELGSKKAHSETLTEEEKPVHEMVTNIIGTQQTIDSKMAKSKLSLFKASKPLISDQVEGKFAMPTEELVIHDGRTRRKAVFTNEDGDDNDSDDDDDDESDDDDDDDNDDESGEAEEEEEEEEKDDEEEVKTFKHEQEDDIKIERDVKRPFKKQKIDVNFADSGDELEVDPDDFLKSGSTIKKRNDTPCEIMASTKKVTKSNKSFDENGHSGSDVRNSDDNDDDNEHSNSDDDDAEHSDSDDDDAEHSDSDDDDSGCENDDTNEEEEEGESDFVSMDTDEEHDEDRQTKTNTDLRDETRTKGKNEKKTKKNAKNKQSVKFEEDKDWDKDESVAIATEAVADNIVEEGINEGFGKGYLKWKENLGQKASESFLQRLTDGKNLKKLIYGQVTETEDMDDSESRDVGGLFTIVKATSKSSHQSLNGLDCSRFSMNYGMDWDINELKEKIKDCFVTGKWENDKDAEKMLAQDDEIYGDFEDLETGEKHHGNIRDDDDDEEDSGEDEVVKKDEKQELTEKEKRLEKKRKLKEAFNTEYDDEDGGTSYYDDLKQQLDNQAQINKSAFDDMEDDVRVLYEGYRPGMYIRVEIANMPCEFVTNFDETYPIILGGLLPGEENIGYVQVRMKKHRWFDRILKTRDPLIISLGWRRFQTILMYSVQDHNGRHRLLKYTPEHMHCHATMWGPITPQGTGLLGIQSVSDTTSRFRIAATGTVLDLDKSITIVKKLKLTGTPFKIYKNTAFIKGMFNSALEVAKFEGASIRSVSGIRGQIKKGVRSPEGAFRASFEDKLLMSDIVFVRTWYPVTIPTFYNPVTSMLLPKESKSKWTGMKTVGQIRKEKNLSLPVAKDSMYKKIVRTPRRFNPLHIPNRLHKQLPFKSKPKMMEKKEKKVASVLDKHRVVIREPEEKRIARLMTQIATVNSYKLKKKKETMKARVTDHKKKLYIHDEQLKTRQKKEKKEMYRLMGQIQKKKSKQKRD
ncbi:ribosome biogenesis protein BMS1 homolog [Saccoglossus kowalevskii]|uniref:Ribosome biogenesis protein BMS1 homolog n=1 Tax=Saccoglossus kowalevskii TaxID=10224 RepID=A0ABM0M960_SACKO|nr:PREDICTED: ribosome biogenesis protein BMS1 homolog [Saccoglossus kowalevskii]